MRFLFSDRKLQELYRKRKGATRYPPQVVDRFFRVVETIRSADDSRVFYELKSLHFEKLKGAQEEPPLRSMRLNIQYRLEEKLQDDEEGEFIEVLRISKRYGD